MRAMLEVKLRLREEEVLAGCREVLGDMGFTDEECQWLIELAGRKIVWRAFDTAIDEMLRMQTRGR